MAISFTKAILEYFGKKPGQNAMDLQAEIKALTTEDREYLKREFLNPGKGSERQAQSKNPRCRSAAGRAASGSRLG